MKKLLSLVLTMALVLGISTMAIAAGDFGAHNVRVRLIVDDYFTLTGLPEDRIVLRSSEGKGDGSDYYHIEYATNTSVRVTASAQGFGNQDINDRVYYRFYHDALGWNEFNASEVPAIPIDVQYDVLKANNLLRQSFVFQAVYRPGDWTEAEAGVYNDLITLTVSPLD